MTDDRTKADEQLAYLRRAALAYGEWLESHPELDDPRRSRVVPGPGGQRGPPGRVRGCGRRDVLRGGPAHRLAAPRLVAALGRCGSWSRSTAPSRRLRERPGGDGRVPRHRRRDREGAGGATGPAAGRWGRLAAPGTDLDRVDHRRRGAAAASVDLAASPGTVLGRPGGADGRPDPDRGGVRGHPARPDVPADRLPPGRRDPHPGVPLPRSASTASSRRTPTSGRRRQQRHDPTMRTRAPQHRGGHPH